MRKCTCNTIVKSFVFELIFNFFVLSKYVLLEFCEILNVIFVEVKCSFFKIKIDVVLNIVLQLVSFLGKIESRY